MVVNVNLNSGIFLFLLCCVCVCVFDVMKDGITAVSITAASRGCEIKAHDGVCFT